MITKGMSGSYRPFLWGVAATLRASGEVLVRSAAGRLDQHSGDRIIERWTDSILRAGDTTLEVSGREHIDGAPPCILMSNHRSHVDIPALLKASRRSMRLVGKRELSRVPIWGPAMKKLGMIFVTRGDKAKAIEELEVAKARFAEGMSIYIAPEGTRSRDGSLGAFKKGGFHLALDLGAPIVPAYVSGTDEIMKPESFKIHAHKTVHVAFGPPIAATGTVDELAAKVREALIALGAS